MASPLRVFVLAVAAVAMVAGVLNIRDNQRTNREFEALRREIALARMAADSCRGSLMLLEADFQSFGESVDSLRTEVRGLEALDPRGVPEARYDEYMERFHAYNDSVSAWDARVDSLRAAEAACRVLVERHNLLSDSLRRRLVAEGVEVESGT